MIWQKHYVATSTCEVHIGVIKTTFDESDDVHRFDNSTKSPLHKHNQLCSTPFDLGI